ncbi:MAG: TonB-dependent receptor [Phenylobacterium sp.]|uniref:TonB-dependent receptor plug domain-containing protein n=1 Tax=Phenylobacterium sp. TaxID=1871053 RepID=UPI00121F3DBC|nr:TonB-dependent receptor [Phenylobacterium sp.]TAJ68489.1 MAG: TonB-dependent receptor [Phenylobacterium sp.]
MSKGRFFCSASVLAAAVAFGASGQAMAQATQSAATEIGEVVVTGSFIRGTPEDAALPVDVIGADELQKQGNPSPVELMKSLTVSNGVLGDTNQFDSRAQGAEGSATINLRGLGPARTLVLWNGRRLVNAPTLNGASPDLNVLPFAAVGRIEVLKDGAAATYGSDAIAGVVNFISRKNTDGLEVSGSYKYIDNASGDWDGHAVWGKQWGDLSLLLTGEYHYKSKLTVGERKFTQPGYFVSPETGFSSGNATTAFVPLGPGSLVGSPAPFTPLAGPQRDTGCAPLGGLPSFSGTTPTCLFNYTPYDNIQETEERFQLYAELDYDLGENTKLHLEGLYAETDTPDWHTSPSYLALQVPTATTNPAFTSGLSAGYFVPASNPGFALYRSQNPTQISAAATGAYIPGVLYRPLAMGGNPLFGDGSSTGSRKFEAYRVSGGISGKFGPDIGYDLSATYMREDLTRIGYDTIVSRFQLALRGLGGPNCNIATGTPGVGGCQYFNPFSNAIQSNYITGQTNPNYSASVANSPDLISWFFQPTRVDVATKVFVTDLVFNGELPGLELGGGAVGWAFGGQYRKQWYQADYDAFSDLTVTPCIDTPVNGTTNCTVRNGPYMFLGGGTPADLSGDNWGAFAEVSLPFTDNFQIQGAARFEDYGSKGGSTFNPKVSARWQISEVFAVRGSIGTTFRAPPLTSLDPGQVTSLQFLGGAFRAVDVVGNPGLDPEKATTYSVGAIVRSGPFRATLDYWNFDFKNPLVTEPVGGIFATLFPTGTGTGNCGAAALAGLQSRFTFNGVCSVANLSRIRTQAINGPGVKTDGIDILATFDVDDFFGAKLQFGTSVTYVHKYKVEATTVEGVTVSPAFNGVGKLNYQTQIYPIPEWKGQFYVEYARDIHTARVTMNAVDSYVDQRTSPFPPNVVRNGANAAVPLTNAGQKIKTQTTFDFTYRAILPWDTTVVATVDNIFDEDPSFARLDLGYDPFTGGALGRTYKLTVTKKF